MRARIWRNKGRQSCLLYCAAGAVYVVLICSVVALFRYHLSSDRGGQRTSPYEESLGSLESSALNKDQLQLLIPRIIHQTYKSRTIKAKHRTYVQSWKLHNPNWAYSFYDDKDCTDFVAKEYPQWYSAYLALPLSVERADFFRYMVVLRYGGVYADVDTECGLTLDEFIRPDDTFLAGWEDEYESADGALDSQFARQRQLLQWVFAATPGHPALLELCERVAANAFQPFTDKTTDALFRTGPGPFTDVVLKHALRPGSAPGRATYIRLLPRVVFGGLPGGGDGLETWEEPDRVVAHLHMGSWKAADFKEKMKNEVARSNAIVQLHALPDTENERMLYPVSVPADPPFNVMTHLHKQGDWQGLSEVERQITKWGRPLIPGSFVTRQPPVKLFMDSWLSRSNAGQVLLDIGAGVGFYSLAAAAAGRSVEAFEMGAKNLAAFTSSIAYNKFSNLISVKSSLNCNAKSVDSKASCSDTDDQGSKIKAYWAMRAPGLANADVGAMRINVYGWEGWLLDTLVATLNKPRLQPIMLELYPQLLSISGYTSGADILLDKLSNLGFTETLHVGPMCLGMKRRAASRDLPFWISVSLWSAKMQQAVDQNIAGQPGFHWCHYAPDEFRFATQFITDFMVPELFLLQRPGS